jgi:hypothetical protein
MYNHREEKRRVDVVDLDPYGTAAPFIDAAVQCVNDGGKITKLLFCILDAYSSMQAYYALHVLISLCLQRRISLKNGDAYLVCKLCTTHNLFKVFRTTVVFLSRLNIVMKA